MIASVVTTFLFLDYGVSVSYPTVVISALSGLNNETNPNESIHMTAIETSWLGKALKSQRIELSISLCLPNFSINLFASFFRLHHLFGQAFW